MTGRILRLALRSAGLAGIIVCAVSLLNGGEAAAQASVSRKSDLQSRLARQALTFFLARGPQDSCGPDCHAWIAADGQFDEGSAARFRAFLARTKVARDVPIFFNSNGGLQEEAMAIGRIMRERRMRAGIAVTRPDICKQRPDDQTFCDTAKKSGRPLTAEWTSFDANCNSACGMALIGAADRWIPPGTAIGIHAPAYYCFLRSGRIVGQKGDSRLAAQCRRYSEQGAAQLAAYVRDMGIASGFVDAMRKVPHDEVRYLTREELVAFGIDTGEVAETPWMGKPGTAQVTVKVLLEAAGADGGRRMGWLELQCAASGTSSIVFVRPAIGGDEGSGTEVTLTAGERKFEFSSKDMSIHKNPTEPAAPYLRRRVSVATPEIAALAAQAAMDLRITPNAGAAGAKTQVTRISNAGLEQRWRSVAKSCGEGK